MKTNAHHRYFLYARKSTDSEDRQVRSIPDQLAEMRELAEKLQLDIVDIFTESQTAKAPGRPIFNDMLARVETGEADGLLAWHPDRLARNWTDGGRILGLLDTKTLQDLKFAMCPFEPTSAGKYTLAMLFCQSKYYVDNLSDNVKRSFRQMLKNGQWPEKAPVGYRNDRSAGRLVIDPERAPFIQKVFELYATGTYTLVQLRETLSAMGFTARSGGQLSVSNFQYILKNPFYHGLMRFTGEYYEGKHEPLVSKELFDKAQAVLTARSQPRRKVTKLKPYPYRAFFACGDCGCMITAETQKGHNYLRCTRKRGLCRQPFTREEQVADQITEAIRTMALPADTADWLVEQLEAERTAHTSIVDNQLQQLREQAKTKAVQVDRLIHALADGTLSHEEFRSAKNQVILAKRELEEKAVTLEKHRNSWFEPDIGFVKASKQATLLAETGTLIEKRDFFRKAGSNRKLTNKRVDWQPSGAWKLVVNAGRFAQPENAASDADAAFVGEPDQHVSKLGD